MSGRGARAREQGRAPGASAGSRSTAASAGVFLPRLTLIPVNPRIANRIGLIRPGANPRAMHTEVLVFLSGILLPFLHVTGVQLWPRSRRRRRVTD